MTPHYADATVTVYAGDCLEVLRELPDASVDAVVTDPPYGLEFMGKEWDRFGRPSDAWDADIGRNYHSEGRTAEKWQIPRPRFTAGHPFQQWCQLWAAECLRVLKPGGHLLAFGGTRTSHRLACAIEDAGFEIRDSIAWLYGQGFPKSLNVSASLDAARCRCNVGESPYGTGESPTEHGLRDVPDADVPPSGRVDERTRKVLLEGLSESSAPADGAMPAAGSVGATERLMEGRRDPQASEGELQGSSVRPLSPGVPEHGASGRLHHGAPSGDGAVDRPPVAPLGSGEPQGPQPVEQLAGEPRAVSVERRSQAWGGWPVCERCAKPAIPDGLGTAAKPAHEPVVVARRPLAGTVAANVLAWGTGALNVDGCRVEGEAWKSVAPNKGGRSGGVMGAPREHPGGNPHPAGRWPANVVLDEHSAHVLDEQSGEVPSGIAVTRNGGGRQIFGQPSDGATVPDSGYTDTGGASRFFYTAKAASDERVRINGTAHPTVKPLALMRWLVRLVTPPGGVCLDPFAGSGTTIEAAILEGFRCIGIEREADYLPLITQRIHRRRDPVEAVRASGDDGGLFDLLDGGAA